MAKMVSQQTVPGVVLNENATTGATASASRSMFVWIAIAAALAAWLFLAVIWSPTVADEAIGENVANTLLLGSTARTVALNSAWFSLAFAIAAGLGPPSPPATARYSVVSRPWPAKKDRRGWR